MFLAQLDFSSRTRKKVSLLCRECAHVCVLPPGGVSEEVLDEGSDQFHPQLDVAVRLLKRRAGHLGGPLVQRLLLLRATECETQVCIQRRVTHTFIIISGCGYRKKADLLQLALQLLVLRYYGDLSLQVTVNRAVTEIRGAN